MKRAFILFFGLIFAVNIIGCSQAAETVSDTAAWTTAQGLERVNKIGKALLEKNSLPTQVTFTVVETDEVNAFASGEKEICVYTGLLKFVNDDDELAGVIAHEIGHIVNNHVAKQNVLASVAATVIANSSLSDRAKQGANIANQLTFLKMSRNDEYEADITGVDLMIKAGYNPLAMVSMLYKISGNYFDFVSDHPSGDKRTMYIFDYITYTYPDKSKFKYANDSYIKFLEYANPIVEKRNSNPKKLASFNKKQAKLKAKREKKLQKYKKTTNTLGWDASYNLLKSFAASQEISE